VGLAGGAHRFGGHSCESGEPGVARPADLDGAVVDELGDGEEASGGDQDDRGGAGGGDDPAGGGRQAHEQPTEPADSPLEVGNPAEEEGEQRPQLRPQPGPGHRRVMPRSHNAWMGTLQPAVADSIDLS